MAKDASYIGWVTELLASLGAGVDKKAMFGGYGIFDKGVMFALVSPEPALYFKADDTNRAAYVDAGSMNYRTMPYFMVPAEILEGGDDLIQWARLSIVVAHASAKGRKRRK